MAKLKEEARIGITHKLCKGECGLDRDISNFCKKADAKDGYQTICKICINEKKKEARKKK
jgi:hypothetical protein